MSTLAARTFAPPPLTVGTTPFVAPVPASGSTTTRRESSGALTPRIIIDESSVPHRRYSLGKQLGKGGFARVYELMEITGSSGSSPNELIACKVIAKRDLVKPKAMAKLHTEIKIHSSLQQRHIVKFLRYFEDTEHVYILLELCTNQTLMELNKRRKRMTEPEARYFMLQILSGVEHMHRQRVIHRDLKLGNLFLDEHMHIKIGDFGLAAQLDHDGERKTTICGTPNYIAPEILDGGKAGHSYEVDIWSIGVILYTLVVGKPPFETSDVKTTYKRIRANSYSFPDHVSISAEARDLIKRILVPRPELRPTLAQIRADPFFTCGPLPQSLPASCLHAPYVVNENDFAAASLQKQQQQQQQVTTGTLNNNNTNNIIGMQKDVFSSNNTASNGPNANSGVSGTVSTAMQPTLQSGSMRLPLRSVNSLNLHSQGPTVSTNSGSYAHAHAGQVAQSARPSSTSSGVRRPYAAPPAATSGSTVASTASSTTLSSAGALTARPSSSSAATGLVSGPKRLDSWSGSSVGTTASAGSSTTSKPTTASAAPASGVAELERIFASSTALTSARGPQQPSTASFGQLWVLHWADFSAKYGLAYLLSNGYVGAHFNDSTKMLLRNDTSGTVDYYDRKRSPQGAFDEHEQHTLDVYPESLRKKITLIKYFRKHFEQLLSSPSGSSPSSPTKSPVHTLPQQQALRKLCGLPSSPAVHASQFSDHFAPCNDKVLVDDLVYCKRWVKDDQALTMRMSNKSVQISFVDGTHILLCGEGSVTIIDPVGTLSSQSLTSAFSDARPEITRKLRYMREVLYQMQHPQGAVLAAMPSQ